MSNAAANTPKPAPLTGQRVLSAKEEIRRAQALACNLPEKNTPSCTGQAYLGVFFDGTGNNRDKDVGKHKQSNVVRLWRVHKDNSAKLGVAPAIYIRKEYVPGVGTPFPLIGEPGETKMGKAMANGGQSRIVWGLIQSMNALHRYVKGGVPLMYDEPAGEFAQSEGDGSTSSAIEKLRPFMTQLKGILLSSKPTVTQYNVSVYGFSRGAAEARVFCQWFYRLCEKNGDEYTFAGVPVRIYFLGIFDTVAAVGPTSGDIVMDNIASGKFGWAKGNLRIHPAIERCVHFVASHEVRASFPLDSVRYLGKYPANCFEVVYPGVHSDVGGGYSPGAQGRSILPADGLSYNFSAQFPYIDMYHEAMATGVPLVPIHDMSKESLRDFTPTLQTREDYNAYIKADTVSGTVEEICRQRMNRYRFYRYRKLETFSDEAKAQGSPAADESFLKLTNAHFKAKCIGYRRKHANAPLIAKQEREIEERRGLPHKGGGYWDIRTQDILEASIFPEDLEMWRGMHRVGELPKSIINFLDHYIHDSMAGFYQDGVNEYQLNDRGHFRHRTIFDNG
ncbi:DUF2235 domain-containing protein [Massilia atriviolacea]|uniref:DUF2235 domain-containing protein n=1 Tax=Massilia atriviolacea TaxID=2495579 RepID=A0A430HQ36_9BURK|nr:DUF2235 domain-containing protein [Massilia atriviolacea]RSZ59634.1 DUF2235 domain-containing protein [Massilia atriviolacea]